MNDKPKEESFCDEPGCSNHARPGHRFCDWHEGSHMIKEKCPLCDGALLAKAIGDHWEVNCTMPDCPFSAQGPTLSDAVNAARKEIELYNWQPPVDPEALLISAREMVFYEVNRERDYQDEKWGTIEERPHTVGEWLLVLKGELDEAILAWQKNTNGRHSTLNEVRQVASVAVACLEQHGCPPREG